MLALGLFLLVTRVTAGPYGAYIGCFDINSMGLRPENLQVSINESSTAPGGNGSGLPVHHRTAAGQHQHLDLSCLLWSMNPALCTFPAS